MSKGAERQQPEEAPGSASLRWYPQPLTRIPLLLFRAGIDSLAWQVTTARVISEGVAFLSFSCSPDGEMSCGAALASPKRQPCNQSPGRRAGWSIMTSKPGTKEAAIKGLVTDIKSYCAALTPPALELWDCWVTGTGSLLVPQRDAASLLSSGASSFRCGLCPHCHRPCISQGWAPAGWGHRGQLCWVVPGSLCELIPL